MSQIEARARAKAENPNAILLKKILRQVARWAFPVIGLLVMLLGILSYMGGRGEDDLAIATDGVAEAEGELLSKKIELKDAWEIALEASTGATAADLDLVNVAKDDVIKFGASLFEKPIPAGFTLDSYNPILLAVDDNFVMSYVVALSWSQSNESFETAQSGNEMPQSAELPMLYPPVAGLLDSSDDQSEFGNSRYALVWFEIGQVGDDSGLKQIRNLRGGPSTIPDRSNVQ